MERPPDQVHRPDLKFHSFCVRQLSDETIQKYFFDKSKDPRVHNCVGGAVSLKN